MKIHKKKKQPKEGWKDREEGGGWNDMYEMYLVDKG